MITTINTQNPTNELLLAIFLGDSYIDKNKDFVFKIHPFNLQALVSYMESNETYLSINKSVELNTYIIPHSFVVEKFMKKYLTDDLKLKNITSAVLTPNLLMLWLTLFAQHNDDNDSKSVEAIIYNDKINYSTGQLIMDNFRKHFKTSKIVFLEDSFIISDFDNLFLYSIKSNRPVIQTMQLVSILNKKERNITYLRSLAKGELMNAYC